MKKIFTSVFILLLSVVTFAQSPEKISYQAVVRNNSNQLVTNATVGIRISLLQDSPDGTAVYVETHTTSTNANGLISIEIGNGTIVSGSISAIDWADGPYFIKTETDPEGGENYTIAGTSQLLSVPYAIHAKTAESISGGITEEDPVFGSSIAAGISASDTALWNKKSINAPETDPVFGTSVAAGITSTDTAYWNKKLDDFKETDPIYKSSPAFYIKHSDIIKWNQNSGSYTETDPEFAASVAAGITTTDTTYWNNKLDSYTETDPEFAASVAAGITTTDTTSWNNKLDSYTETDPEFAASVAAGITTTDTTSWNNKLDSYTETDPEFAASVAAEITAADTTAWNNKLDSEVDGDVTNEIQTLSLSNDTIYLSNGGGNVKLPASGSSLPDQSGQSGKYLKTDGTNASWETAPSGGAIAMIPFASGTPVTLTTVLGGLSNTSSAIGFGNNASGITTSGGTIDLTGGPGVLLNFGFSLPEDGTLKSITAFFSSTNAVALIGSSITITAQLYQSTTPNNTFTAVSGAKVDLSPSLTGIITIGTISNGTTTGLNIPLTQGSRYLLAFTANVIAGIDVATTITGYASAGISIQ